MAKKRPIMWFVLSDKDSLDMYRKSTMNSSNLIQKNDFTTLNYARLLQLAKLNYKFIGYWEIDLNEKFVLWRHDCDYSLNRSLRLAQIENQELVRATYFLNPHCEFYNLLEKDQAQIVKKILALGHDIGLHFDSAYYDIQSEDQLDALVEREANWLEEWFGVKPVAFSFHNPSEFFLSCDQDNYGGLPNCYSKTFKTSITYCSDSNGYWRFKRLQDVLESAQDSFLQVLTHPGWWQEVALHPRERIFRSVYGRANAIMHLYDVNLEKHGRENLTGPAGNLNFLKEIDDVRFQLCDYLWNRRLLQTLFIELYRLHESQIKQLVKAMLHKKLHVSTSEVNEFFEDATLTPDLWELFELTFGESLFKANGSSEEAHNEWAKIRDQLLYHCANVSDVNLEKGCIYLCGVMEELAKWGLAQESIRHDGLSVLDEICISTDSTVLVNSKRLHKVDGTAGLSNKGWQEFIRIAKSAIQE